jgi:hypothetical protein
MDLQLIFSNISGLNLVDNDPDPHSIRKYLKHGQKAHFRQRANILSVSVYNQNTWDSVENFKFSGFPARA